MIPRILAASIALLLAPTAFAITDTWDGGGADNFFSTGNNWLDNTAPLSDLANTDLIFAGAVRTSPVFSGAFSAKSLTFNNTASDFVLSGSGFTLTVGSGGITNVDLASQTFGPVVAAANQTISSGNGLLNFNAGLSISPGVNVALGGGGPITIVSFLSGTGTLNKGNAGNLLVRSSATPILADLNLTAGQTLLQPAGGTQTVGSSGSIAVGAAATFNINESLTLTGGAQLTKASGGIINIASGKTLRLESGSDFVTLDPIQITAGNVTVTGVGSTFQSSSTTVSNGAAFAVLSGGSLQSGTFVDVGISSNGTLLVDGAGSSVSAVGTQTFWGSGTGGNATVTFSNNASGTISELLIGRTGGNASVQVLSGADIINASGVSIGSVGVVPANASVLVTGAGTTWQSGADATVGSTVTGIGVGSLTVGEGALFTASMALVINQTGTVSLNGGTLVVGGALTKNGTLNFTSGALSIIDSWSVGAAGLLGANVTFDGTRRFTTTGTTTVDALSTLTLNGGSLTTAALVNNGAVAFSSGTLAITGAGGLSISALGANVTLATGANLQVTNTATVASGASLIVDGGSVNAGALSNAGLVEHDRGTLTIAGAVTNLTGADFFAAKPLTVGGVFTNQSGARLTLQSGTGRINGAGSISNSGLITGEGTLAVAVTNTPTGDIRADSGKTLYFTGSFAANAGELILQGGTLDFATAITNGATGFISGRGALLTNGLTNQGALAFSGGNTDLRGDVTNSAGGRIVTSGAGAVTTFFDDVIHNGTEIRTSAGSSSVFFGAVSGSGPYTGTGTVYLEGDLRPGNSPALVTFGGDVVYGSLLISQMELGGTARGTQYDALNVAGKLTFGGTLNVPLISGFQPAAGNVFNLYDFGTTAGTFSTVNLPALAPGLAWSQANLYTAGEIQVALDPVFISRTWDGGGVNNDWITDANWTLDVQPLNNATADLIFTGNMRLTPSVDTPWNVHSITFTNAAGAFTITGPQGVTIGAGGIVNDDADTQTITAAITLSASESFTAAAGDLAIASVALAGQTLAINGANDVTLNTTSGTGTIDKNNAGSLDVTGALGTGGVTLNANTGQTNSGASQTLAALNIGDGATVTLGAIPPSAVPEFDGEALPGASAFVVPEPGSASLMLFCAALFGLRRRRTS